MTSRHYLRKKGAVAEKIIHRLATKTFLTDCCYPNPEKPDGNELCDLLIAFGDTAIIWQIKDLKTGKRGRYKKAEVQKNLRQLSGARRSLFDLKIPIELENPRRGKELFNPKQIKSVHLISVLMGDGEEPFPFVEIFKNRMIHVFTREFADIALSELDTVSDFCLSLQRKEERNPATHKKECWVIGGEGNLLAKYLENLHSFSWMDDFGNILVTEDVWPTFSKLPQSWLKQD